MAPIMLSTKNVTSTCIGTRMKIDLDRFSSSKEKEIQNVLCIFSRKDLISSNKSDFHYALELYYAYLNLVSISNATLFFCKYHFLEISYIITEFETFWKIGYYREAKVLSGLATDFRARSATAHVQT